MRNRCRRRPTRRFTFPDYADMPPHNHFAEWQIGPAVLLRSNRPSNRSGRKVAAEAVLLLVNRTLRLRGHDPTQTIAQARKTYVLTGRLPPLPGSVIANG